MSSGTALALKLLSDSQTVIGAPILAYWTTRSTRRDNLLKP